MIQTSAEYQAAIVGSPRRIEILATVNISDPDMEYGDVTMDSQAPWSQPETIRDKVFSAPPRYETLERGRWLLDGRGAIFPDDYQVPEPMGAVNDNLSGDDGTFSPAAYLVQPIAKVDVLQAFSLFFSSDPVDGVPKDFTVEVRSGEQVFYTKTVTGNTATELAFDGFTVYTPTDIRLTVTRWSLPGRRLRLLELIPGVFERWSGRVLVSFNCVHNGDFSCLTLPYGTMEITLDNQSRRFEPRKKDSLFASIEDRQGIEPYIGVRLPSGAYERVKLGVFYQAGDGWKTSTNDPEMSWRTVDIVGLVANRTYLPPSPLPTTLAGWFASVVAQLGENFKNRYHVDQNYANLPVTANSIEDVSGKKCGDILRWACMATGTWPRADAETGNLMAEPLWDQGNKVTLDNLTAYPTMKANKSIAALIFTLADANKTEYVVSGNSASSEDTVSISNPFIHTQAQALAAARQILSCYGGNIFETNGRGDPSSEIGDVDVMWLDESTAATARRMMQSFPIRDGVLQGAQVKAIQADGSYLFENCAVITQSGQWQAPPGVEQLFLAVGQGAQGGMRGQDGTLSQGERPSINVDTGVMNSGGTYNADYGQKGDDGVGGKIWYGAININPQQIFDVHIGEGGAPSQTYGIPGSMGGETSFGAYSSANGQVFPNGYTDIRNGAVYGRTGVKAPVDGSSDGAAGGAGGEPGIGEWRKATLTIQGSGRKIWYTYWRVVKEPGKGKIPSKGADGFVLVWWDKPEAEV